MKRLGTVLSLSFVWSFALAEGSGKIIVEGQGFLAKPPSQVAGSEAHFNGEYERKGTLSNTWSTRFHPVWRSTTAKKANETDAVLDWRELSVEHISERTFFRVGFFTPLWEGTDGLNPMDIASVQDLGDPLKAATLGSAGVQTGVTLGVFEAEIFWVPHQTRSRIFGVQSPCWPRRVAFPLRNEIAELHLPSQVDYVINDRDTLNNARSNNVGGRMQVHGDVGDAALGYFEGAAQTPAFVPTLDADLDPDGSSDPNKIAFLLRSPIAVTPVDYRRRTYSGLVSFPVKSFIFRMAARSDTPIGDDPRLPKWSQQAVAGFEKATEIGSNTVTLVLQGAYGRRSEDASLISVADLFDRALLAGLRWPVGEKWTFMFSAFRSLRDQSNFMQAEATRRISDNFTTEFFVQTLDGRSDTLLGILSDRDRAGARIVYAF